MKFVLIGETTLLVRCAELIQERGHSIAVIASRDGAVLSRATGFGWPTCARPSEIPEDLAFDHLFSVVNYAVLPPRLLQQPSGLAVNYHDGPLPRYAGIHATSWAILNGETDHGVTWHVMVDEIDAGPVLEQSMFRIDDDDTAYTLNLKAYDHAYLAFERLLARLERGDQNAHPQDLSQRTYFGLHRRPPLGGLMDWSRPVDEIGRLIRALDLGHRHRNTLGTAKVSIGGRLLVIGQAAPLAEAQETGASPGTVLRLEQGSLDVAATGGVIRISQLKTLTGRSVDLLQPCGAHALRPGGRFDDPTHPISRAYVEEIDRLAREELGWVRRLVERAPLQVPLPIPEEDAQAKVLYWRLPGHSPRRDLASVVAAFVAWLQRVAPQESRRATVGYTNGDRLRGGAYKAPVVPLELESEPAATVESAAQTADRRMRSITGRPSFLLDVVQRFPALHGQEVMRYPVIVAESLEPDQLPELVRRGAGLLLHAGGPDGIEVVARVDPELEPMAESLRDSWHAFFAAAVRQPKSPMDELPIMESSQRDRVIRDANRTAAAFDLSRTVVDDMLDRARGFAERNALEWPGGSMRYDEVERRTRSLAARLVRLGVERGDTVAVRAERGPERLLAIWGILRAGAAFLPIDTRAPPRRVAQVLEVAGCRMLLDRPGFEAPGRVDLTVEMIELDRLDGDDTGDALDARRPRAADPAYVLFTSGTTGEPKGVRVRHDSLTNRLRWMADELELSATDRFVHKTPYTFDVSVWELTLPFVLGSSLVLPEPGAHMDPARMADVIESEGTTICHFVPTMLEAFLESVRARRARGEPLAFEALRHVICSGEALGDDLRREFYRRIPSAQLTNLYGPTEACIDVTCWPCPKDARPGRMWIGPPVANTQLYVLDSRQRPQPFGAMGELYIGGVQVADGYVNRPELTAERFIDDPFGEGRLYRTGDLARMAPDGNVDYLGRLDSQAKLRGMRIEPDEVAAVLRTHPTVGQAAAVVEQRPEKLVAYATPADIDAAMLMDYLRERLPPFMVPDALVPLAELPLGSSGKLDRRRLPPAPRIIPSHASVGDAGWTPTEQLLRRIVARVLNIEPGALARDTALAALGVDSLEMMRIQTSALEDEGIELSTRALARAETLAELARFVDRGAAGGDGRVADAARLSSVLEELVQAEDQVIAIHSSLPLFGIAAEALRPALTGALNRWVAAGRTVVVAAYNFDFARTRAYHWQRTRPRTGILADWCLKDVDGARIVPHPMYAWAAAGPLTADLLRQPCSTTFGDDSVFAFLERHDARYLLLGTNALTQAHRYEELKRVPYRYFKTFEGTVDYGEGPRPASCRMYVRDLEVGPRSDEDGLMLGLLAGITRTLPVGPGFVRSLKAKDVRRVVMDALEKDPFVLLSNADAVRAHYQAQRGGS